MRRAIVTLVGTVAGLAALLSYKTHSAASADAAGTPPPAPMTAAPSAKATPSAKVTPAKGTSAGATPAAPGMTSPATAPPSSAPAAQSRTVTGTVANTQYGPMQVQLTLAGTKITQATVVQRTNSGAESDQIDSFAIPKLTSETLTAQSARIDAVSGATYTSSGYIQSLQSALNSARG